MDIQILLQMNAESMDYFNRFWSGVLDKIEFLFGVEICDWLKGWQISDFQKHSIGLICQFCEDVSEISYVDILKLLNIDLIYRLKWQRDGSGKFEGVWSLGGESDLIAKVYADIEVMFGKDIECDFRRLVLFSRRMHGWDYKQSFKAILNFDFQEPSQWLRHGLQLEQQWAAAQPPINWGEVLDVNSEVKKQG
jgi:hypothetical protein